MISRSLSRQHLNVRLSNKKTLFLAVSSVIAGMAILKVSTDEGLQRALVFNSRAIVPLVKYRYFDWKTKNFSKEERSKVFHQLHLTYAPVAVQTVMDLQGFYIKFAQLLSGMDGAIPDEYISKLKRFQNDCPIRDIEQVVETIEQEIGEPFHNVFRSIDPKPLGSASIGQTHRAVLLNGQEVCVKVQHPNAERFFRNDLATTRFFTSIAQPEQLVVFDEIEKHFVNEFDYEAEARNLLAMNQILEEVPRFKKSIVIPKPIFSTRKVLVMTYLKGETLHSKQKRFLRETAEKQGKSVKQLEDEFKEKLESGNASAPPSETLVKGYGIALRARDLVRNTVAMSYNVVFGYVTGSAIPLVWSEVPLKADQALTSLYDFFGYAMFHHGMFSSDPHGGNVMHLDDEKLGLIDMGQVKRIDHKTRVQLARLVIALAKDRNQPEDDKEIAQLWRECGYKTKLNKDGPAADLARFNFDRLTPDLTDKYGGIAVMMENLEKEDPLITLPNEFIMPMRCSALMRMNALGLGYGGQGAKHSRVAPFWKKYAQELLLDEVK